MESINIKKEAQSLMTSRPLLPLKRSKDTELWLFSTNRTPLCGWRESGLKAYKSNQSSTHRINPGANYKNKLTFLSIYIWIENCLTHISF